jgi:hypothetical protein
LRAVWRGLTEAEGEVDSDAKNGQRASKKIGQKKAKKEGKMEQKRSHRRGQNGEFSTTGREVFRLKKGQEGECFIFYVYLWPKDIIIRYITI